MRAAPSLLPYRENRVSAMPNHFILYIYSSEEDVTQNILGLDSEDSVRG
jgi:hypothetical protein